MQVEDPTRPIASQSSDPPRFAGRDEAQPLASGHWPSLSGRNASAAGIVARMW